MLTNYLKIAFRALWRNKVNSSINIIGLSLGICACILIVLFVKDEWTFDTFHSKANRIYRAYVKEDYGENEKFFNTVTPFPLGPTLKESYQEIEQEVRINQITPMIRVKNDQFTDPVLVAGQNFFSVFDFEVTGDKSKALADQKNVVLSRSAAQKYFGSIDPIGKILEIQLGEEFEDFEVTGVVEEIPTNSSIQFDIVISDLNYPKLYSERALTSGWFNVTPETYILLSKDVAVSKLEAKFPTLFKTLLGEDYEASKYTVGLQRITDIHLNQDFPAGIAPVSNPKYAYILAGIALLILFVACINFITLSIGSSLKRSKEVGIRKVVGAQRAQITTQFLSEAVLITIISLVVGIIMALLCLPLFNSLAAKNLSFEFNRFIILVIAALVVVIGIFSGSYPALLLSRFKPVMIFKGSPALGSDKQLMRRILVGVQLVLGIFLISSTLIMRNQLQFLMNKDLGFDKEQLMVIQLNVPANGRLLDRINSGFEKSKQFKNELSRIPDVKSICAASHDFGNGGWINIGYTDDTDNYRTFDINIIDDDYIPVLNMEMVAGRNFSADNSSDARRSIIVNESFAREYGWGIDAIGKRIPGKNFQDHEIIGVVKDFNYTSLYSKVPPLVMVKSSEIVRSGIENISVNNSPIPKLFIRLVPGNMSNTIDQITTTWNKLTGGEEFAFTFTDQALQAQYRADQNLGKIVSIATILAIIIGGLGLYGLASLAMQGKIKEVSIRKVLGATSQSLLYLLSRDYVAMVIISLVISVPITMYLMKDWLSTFEYRISIGPGSFLLAGLISLLIAMFAISYQTIKVALTQPAESLKNE